MSARTRRRSRSIWTPRSTGRSPRSAPARKWRAVFPRRRRCRNDRQNDVGLRHDVQRRDLRTDRSLREPQSAPDDARSRVQAAARAPRQKIGGASASSSFSPTRWRRAVSSSTTNRTAGWACVFKRRPRGEPSQIIIHVRMLDESNVDQQEALGVIGVNLLYGAFYHQPAGKIDRVAPGESRAGSHPGGHDQVLRAGLRRSRQSADEPATGQPGIDQRGHVHRRRRDRAAGGSFLQKSDPGRARQFSARHLRDERHAGRRAHAFSSRNPVVRRKTSSC